MQLRIALFISALASVAAGVGLFATGGPGRSDFVTVNGSVVELYGVGLYRNDSFLIGAGLRGTDAATLVVAVPLLLFALALHHRNSTRGAALLAGVLAYFAYYYASQSLGTAYNPLFLVYVALMSASAFALSIAVRDLSVRAHTLTVDAQFPARAVATFLLVIAGVLAAAWLPPIISAFARGETPPLVAHYTTAVTWALDLGVIAPLAATGGVLVMRRRPLGVVFAGTLLTLCLIIGVALASQGLAQIVSGVPLSAAEIARFMAPFALLTLGGIWPAVLFYRAVPD